jgi:hypothetical protein
MCLPDSHALEVTEAACIYDKTVFNSIPLQKLYNYYTWKHVFDAAIAFQFVFGRYPVQNLTNLQLPPPPPPP